MADMNPRALITDTNGNRFQIDRFDGGRLIYVTLLGEVNSTEMARLSDDGYWAVSQQDGSELRITVPSKVIRQLQRLLVQSSEEDQRDLLAKQGPIERMDAYLDELCQSERPDR